MKAIDKIIFNELASRRAVVLPGLGTLGVVRRPAQLTGKELSPPVNQIVYSKEEAQDASSIIMLMETMGVTRDAAKAAYAEWLAEVRACEGISLNGVGYVKDNVFIPSAELGQMLNPTRQRQTTTDSKPADARIDSTPDSYCRNSNCLANILSGIAILMLLIAGCVFFLHRGCKFRADQPVEVKPLHTVVSDQPAAVIHPPQPVATISGQFHLIAGSFAYESNADELIQKLTSRYPDLNIEKIETPSWFMVSVFQGVDAQEADAANRRLSAELNNYEMWVYKSR